MAPTAIGRSRRCGATATMLSSHRGLWEKHCCSMIPTDLQRGAARRQLGRHRSMWVCRTACTSTGDSPCHAAISASWRRASADRRHRPQPRHRPAPGIDGLGASATWRPAGRCSVIRRRCQARGGRHLPPRCRARARTRHAARASIRNFGTSACLAGMVKTMSDATSIPPGRSTRATSRKNVRRDTK